MADRTLTVELRADATGYRQQLNQAAIATRDFGNTVQRHATNARNSSQGVLRDASRDLRRASQEHASTMQGMAAGAGLVGAAMLAGFGVAVAAASRFNAEMSTLRGVANANAEEFAQLREAALDAGAATSFSATEAARGASELARAGVSVRDIVGGGLVGALNLAAAGQLQLADAAEIAASAMVTFDLSGRDVTHIADVLAAAANKAQGGVTDMGFALRQSALVAGQFGLSLEDTVGTLALFASNGLTGSDAGTSFRTMLQRLVPTTDEATGLMEDLGIEMFDATGNFIGISAAAQQLQEGLGGLTEQQRIAAMTTLFGSDAVRGATILYEAGAEGVDEWRNAVNDSGAAARLAATNMDNLSGDLEKLRGSLETALIREGDKATGILRGLTQAADDAVNVWMALPDPIRNVAIGLGLLTAAGMVAIGVAGTMIPRWLAVKAALEAMGPTGTRAAAAIGFATKAVLALSAAATVGGVVYAAYAADKARAKQVTDELANALQEEQTGMRGATDAVLIKNFADQDQLDNIQSLGVSQYDLNEAIRDNEDAARSAADAIHSTLPGLNQTEESHRLLGEALSGSYEAGQDWQRLNREWLGDHQATGRQIVGLIGVTAAAGRKFDDASKQAVALSDAEQDVANKTREAARAGGDLTTSMAATADQTDKLADSTKDLMKAINEHAGPMSAYKAALERKQSDEQKAFAAQREATEDGKASMREFVSSAVVSLGEFSAELERRNKDIINWRTNLVTVASRVGPDIASELAKMGVQAAPLVAQFANGTTAEVNRAAQGMRQNMALGMAGTVQDMELAWRIAAEKSRQGANATADSVARALGAKVEDVQRVAFAYSIAIAGAMNPILSATGNAPIVFGKTPGFENATGDVDRGVGRYAEGGIERHDAQIARGQTPYRVWAEPETGGEAYIPLSKAKAHRSIPVLKTAAASFGLEVIDPRRGGSNQTLHFAGGGIFDALRRIRRHPDLGPGAVNNTADGAMGKEYDAAQELLRRATQLEGGGWRAITSLLDTMAVPYTVTSTTGGRHTATSLHYVGKAVDLVGPSMMRIFKALEGSVAGLQELFYDPPGYSYKRGRRIGPIGGHSDHVHAATYDQGGVLMPGWTMAYNGTNRPEPILTGGQMDRLIQAVSDRQGTTIGQVVIQEAQTPRQTIREMRRQLG